MISTTTTSYDKICSLSKQDIALKKHPLNVFSERASRRVGVLQNQMSGNLDSYSD